MFSEIHDSRISTVFLCAVISILWLNDVINLSSIVVQIIINLHEGIRHRLHVSLLINIINSMLYINYVYV